jgi:GDPmannose 4,6-dehydratase
VVSVDEKYFRPTEVELLIGDPSKANSKLNWTPKYDLAALVKEMVLSDLTLMKKEQYLVDGGFKVNNYFE